MSRSILLVCIVLLLACAVDAAQKPAPKPAPSAKPAPAVVAQPAARSAPTVAATSVSPRVANIAKAIQNARTLKDLAPTFKDLTLTAKEEAELTQQLRSGPLGKKMQELQGDACAQDADRPIAPSRELLNRKRAALAKEQASAITNARASLRAVRPKSTPAGVRKSGGERLTPQVQAHLKSPLPEGSNAAITEVSDTVVGQSVTIDGVGFGSERGRVVILINRAMYYCTVQSWRSGEIKIAIPDETDAGYDPAGRPCLLWVKMPGGETGPYKDIMLKPDPQTYTPAITSMSSKEVHPGRPFRVEGSNFVCGEDINHPKVYVRFPNGLIADADVEEFSDVSIEASLPENFGGLLATNCEVVVSSALDLECEIEAKFVPKEEILAIANEETLYASCTTWPDSIVLCFVGEKNSVTLHDFTLKNGWVVEDSALYVHDHGINAGAYYVTKPRPGSTNARTVVEVWADGYSYCSAGEELFIRGPHGVPYE